MEWLKNLIRKLFRKEQVKLIEEPKNINININTENKNNFKIMLKQQSDLERDDGSGYRIIPNLKLKDMV